MTASILPPYLVLRVAVNGTPLPGAFVALTLPMKTKNPYRLLFGPASPSGALTIERVDILREVGQVRSLFLMDYVDPSHAAGWTGVVEVHALSRSDIANVLLAYDTYHATGIYPSDLSERLTELDVLLAEHEDEQLTVEVSAQEGDKIKIVTIARPVP